MCFYLQPFNAKGRGVQQRGERERKGERGRERERGREEGGGEGWRREGERVRGREGGGGRGQGGGGGMEGVQTFSLWINNKNRSFANYKENRGKYYRRFDQYKASYRHYL